MKLTMDGWVRQMIDRGDALDRIAEQKKQERAKIADILFQPSVVGDLVTLSCPMGRYVYQIVERDGYCLAIPVLAGSQPIAGTDVEDPALCYAAVQCYLGAQGRSSRTPVMMDYRPALHSDGSLRGDLSQADRLRVRALMAMDAGRSGRVCCSQADLLRQMALLQES